MLTALLFMIAVQTDYFTSQCERRAFGCASGHAGTGITQPHADRYQQPFSVAGEPSLYQRSRLGDGDALRFTWLPTFHPAVTVRIEGLTSPRPRLIAHRLEGRAGFAANAVADRVDRFLTPREITDLGTHLASNDPFMQDEVRDTGVRMLDGSRWLVERVTGHDYKIVERANPNEGPIYTTGMAMLRLTGWKFGKIY
ncbi:hypothetical protein [Sphingomonas sp. Leaf67]|uniref:hypothetical protein n=1 Tax=Sphingomonas sp. Leaf67 TaxID=1736230 RepID=UPI000A3F23A6|nr:hypothetical protein [Sphingomonas sp. Leaf67]